MPRDITKTVYTFKELLDLRKAGTITEQALERARRWLCESATDHDWWACTYEWWKPALEQIGFLKPDISFRGFGSQGDGASFTAEIDLDKLAQFLASDIAPAEAVAYDGKTEDFRAALVHKAGGKATDPKYRRLASLGEYCHCMVERTSHHYSHENTCRVSIELNRAGKAKRIEALLNAFEKDADALRKALSRAIYEDLEGDYDYRTSDEALAEDAEANDWTFDASGRPE